MSKASAFSFWQFSELREGGKADDFLIGLFRIGGILVPGKIWFLGFGDHERLFGLSGWSTGLSFLIVWFELGCCWWVDVGGEVLRGVGGGAEARARFSGPARAVHGIDSIAHHASLVSVAESSKTEAFRCRVPEPEFREPGFRYRGRQFGNQWGFRNFRYREQVGASRGGVWGLLEWGGSAIFSEVAGAVSARRGCSGVGSVGWEWAAGWFGCGSAGGFQVGDRTIEGIRVRRKWGDFGWTGGGGNSRFWFELGRAFW